MSSILLVGAGQLGSRHLQALALLQKPATICVVDPGSHSLQRARQLYDEIDTSGRHRLQFVERFDDIERKDFDFAVIATSSDVRFGVLSALVERFAVNYLVLEKLLFQAVSEYRRAEALLEQHGIKAWVNCPRRCYELYRVAKQQYFSGPGPIEFSFRGNQQVGLGCNSIHFIDALNYLSGEALARVDTGGLERELIASKRSGFVEFSGELRCEFSAGSQLVFSARKDWPGSPRTTIRQADLRLELDEASGSVQVYRGEALLRDEVFRAPFQSALTNLVLEQIEASGTCDLADFATSASLHLPFVQALLDFYNDLSGSKSDRLPVT